MHECSCTKVDTHENPLFSPTPGIGFLKHHFHKRYGTYRDICVPERHEYNPHPITLTVPFLQPPTLVLPLSSPGSPSLSLSSRKPTSKSRLNLRSVWPPPRTPPSPALGTSPSSSSSSPNRLVPLSSLDLLRASRNCEGSSRASMRDGRDGREWVADWRGRGMYEE